MPSGRVMSEMNVAESLVPGGGSGFGDGGGIGAEQVESLSIGFRSSPCTEDIDGSSKHEVWDTIIDLMLWSMIELSEK